MNIKLSHVIDLGSCIDIHMYIDTKDSNNYYEKLLDLTEENGRYLVVHGKKEKTKTGFIKAFIEGTIYDKTGEIAIVPNGLFHNDDCLKINNWIDEHESEWMTEIEKKDCMYKIEIYNENSLDNYDKFDFSKLQYVINVDRNSLLYKFNELFIFYEGWQYRIVTPDGSTIIAGAMDPNDKDDISHYVEQERISELKAYVKSSLKEGMEISLTVYDCFQANATLLNIENNGINVKLCDEDMITTCYSCQSNKGMGNQHMFLEYHLIAEIKPVQPQIYTVKLIMSEEYTIKASSPEEAEKIARDKLGCNYYIDDVIVQKSKV